MSARILVIDDDANLRETIRMALTTEGHAVETAAHAAHGLELFGTGEDWNLVFLDYRMPGADGLETLERLHQIRRGIPVVLITGFGSIPVASGALRLGARAFLTKPFGVDDVRRVAAGILDQEER